MVAKSEPQGEKKPTPKDYIMTVGRRKEAVARVRLHDKAEVDVNGVVVKKGDMLVNGKPAEQYFSGVVAKVRYQEPLRITNTLSKFVVTVRVVGGGPAGQLEATVHGIARALDAFDKEKFHAVLRKKGFLTRDARIRERRKVGTGGKARRAKQSPKR